MKFTHGYWNAKEGFKIFNPVEIRDIRIDEESITVFAACKVVRHRGDTLNEPLITIRYSSPCPDIIQVNMLHHKGGRKKQPQFSLNKSKDIKVDICDDKEHVSLASGNLSVRISKKEGFKVDYAYNGRRITGNGNKSTGYVLDRDGNAFMREQLDLGVGEYVYGLGEHFTPFVKNGQVVDIWNEDGGTCSELAYKNIPFYLTNKGYGVFANHPERVSYEVASEMVSRVQFSVPGQCLDYFIIGGSSLKEVLENYTTLTGKPALPPAWSFGLWLTTSFTTSYDEETVNSFIGGMAGRNIPLHVFHFDCFWMKEYQWCDFVWDKDVFPDPEGMLKRLNNKGLKICVWINPYIAQKSCLFDEGMEQGYMVKTKSGDIWQWDKWQAGMGLVDFTNPDAVNWFKGKLKKLIDMGVDCFKTDFGERIPEDVEYFDGSDPVRMHNYYTYLYNKTVFDVLEETRGRREAVLFARSATVGCQQFPVHWGGDCSATYPSMAESLRGGLSLCLSGFGFWSHDISGFERTAPPDIYKRWTAFGLLSTHSRLHGNESYRVPWLFDEEAVTVLRFFTMLKLSLMPYIYSQACEASERGIPVMRAMVLEFMNDPNCAMLDMQYMLGNSLLVAPIFNDKGIAKYYLPKGTWTNFLSGKKIEGGSWNEEKHDYLSLPLMVRPNSIIAVGSENKRPDYDFAQDVTLHIFELGIGNSVSVTVYNTDGQAELKVNARRDEEQIIVKPEGVGKSWKLCLRGIEKIKSVQGGTFRSESMGTVIIPGKNTENITVEL